MINFFKKLTMFSFVFVALFSFGCSSSKHLHKEKCDDKGSPKVSAEGWLNLDTVKAGRFDTGKMWTFDFPPTEYFKEAYNFAPTEEWYNKVRMSALRYANYCSASFVSEDGLVMTNHHCARQSITEVTREGEDLHRDGFNAETLEDERKVPGLFVDQLVLIKDVTAEVQKSIDAGTTDSAKVANRQKTFTDLQKKYKDETGLEIQVITFYRGGKYSLYGFKRFTDVRLVFAPETQLGFFGGDPDNFTYPRYNLDYTFLRVYDENGKPLKTENFFKWSPNGAVAEEPVFVVGNPGTTNRLHTMAQLEYQRDIQYPYTMELLNGMVNVFGTYIKNNPDKAYEMQDRFFSFQNSQKAFKGILEGLRNPFLMAKKQDFENTFKAKIMAEPALATKYGHLWEKIEGTRSEVKQVAYQSNAYNLNPNMSSSYFLMAKQLIDHANNVKKSGAADINLDTVATKIFPETFDKMMSDLMLELNLHLFTFALGKEHEQLKMLTGGNTGAAALKHALSKTVLTSRAQIKALLEKGPDAILGSNDPFIKWVMFAEPKGKELSAKIREITNREADFVQLLGRAVYDVYGTTIPPDATFSLRIADGVVRGFDYNGTRAPAVTTFYGLYDRFYSHDKQFPWNLPERWLDPPAEFELHVPMNFVSTNDIIGGNSGSPVINKNAEIVGLAFDGNIESLPGQFIFDTTANRTVSVHSAGMLESLQDMYKAVRISEELKNGRITK